MNKPSCATPVSTFGASCEIHAGRGLYATAPINAGDVVCVFGGDIVHRSDFAKMPADRARLGLQVDDDYIMVSAVEGPGDWINHSCDPNAGLRGQVVLVAMRDIAVGEEIRYDYAMSDTLPYDEFECGCGAAQCRGKVTANDWQLPHLWAHYDGYFAPHVARRIDHFCWSQNLHESMVDANSLRSRWHTAANKTGAT